LKKSLRPILRRPAYGFITQGTIFSCAQAARYMECEVFGLTITARCDMAQRKYPVLNYLPVVKLSDWLRKDGLDILTETEKSEQYGAMNKMLRQASISENLPRSVPLQKIADVHFPLNEGNKAKKATAEKFHGVIKEINAFESLVTKDDGTLYNWFRDHRQPKVVDIVKRLSKHAVLGHYFLETLSFDGKGADGFVCLLREVNTIPRLVAEKLGIGLDKASYEDLCRSSGLYTASLTISPHDLAMPISEIASPTMEHVLQVFSHLFGRIGVADPDEVLIGDIVEACLDQPLGGAG